MSEQIDIIKKSSKKDAACRIGKKIAEAAAWVLLAACYVRFGCPIRRLTGVSCPGCGMTRALFALFRGDPADAAYCHPMIFAVPFFIAAAALVRKNRKAVYALFFTFCGALAAVYAYRLATGCCPDIVFAHPEEGVIYKIIRSVFYVS